MNDGNKFALVQKVPAELEKAEPGTQRVLSGMVSDALALVKKQRRSKPRIVLVNDDPDALRLMKLLILDRFKEAAVLAFQSGTDAWQELQRKDPDLLITDMQRPEDTMDGWAMIPFLAEKKAKYPVLVVSAYSESAAKHYDRNGKPISVTFRELLEQARQTLDITAITAPFENEEFLMVLEAKVLNCDSRRKESRRR